MRPGTGCGRALQPPRRNAREQGADRDQEQEQGGVVLKEGDVDIHSQTSLNWGPFPVLPR